MKKQEITTTELFEAIGSFSNDIARQFKDLNKRMATKDDLKGVRDDLKAFATKDDLKSFATKDDLKEIKEDTQKILQLFPALLHKEDRKVNTLVERLVAKRVFARDEVADLLDAHPLIP